LSIESSGILQQTKEVHIEDILCYLVLGRGFQGWPIWW